MLTLLALMENNILKEITTPEFKLTYVPNFTDFKQKKMIRAVHNEPCAYGWYRKDEGYLYIESFKEGLTKLVRRPHRIINTIESAYDSDEIHTWIWYPQIHSSLDDFTEFLINHFKPKYNHIEPSLTEIEPDKPITGFMPRTYIKDK